MSTGTTHAPGRAEAGHRVDTIDALRGIAALAVCWFHFTQAHEGFLPAGWLKASGEHGWLGVEVFFVISGFVLPYALYQAGYHLRDYPVFLWKRLLRLHPPYVASIFVIIALGYFSLRSPGFISPTYHVSPGQVLLHLGYLNGIFGSPWLNVVFWTLAIEFQYYLLIGLIYPFLTHRDRRWQIACVAALVALSFLSNSSVWIFHFLLLFLLGMATFLHHTGMLTGTAYIIGGVVLSAGLTATHSGGVGLVAAMTALVIAIVKINNRLLRLLGDISYSLYLLHVPIGGRIINGLANRASSFPAKVGVLLLALAATLGAAWLLYYFVERPARKWSSAVRFKSATAPSAP